MKNNSIDAYIYEQKKENYLLQHSSKTHPILDELYQETSQTTLNARMMSGPLQGLFLSFLSKISNPKTILEIGTFTGYSTLCLAEGLVKDGKIYTIDINEEIVPIQEKHFNKSAYKNQIISLNGDALELIPTIKESFDMVFIDAHKEDYIKYFNLIINKMNQGGLIISDNVLWDGKVIDEDQTDGTTQAIRDYNEYISKRDDIEVVMLPIRDGISLARVL